MQNLLEFCGNRNDFKQLAENILKSTLDVEQLNFSIPANDIVNEKQLEEWVSKINFKQNILYVPLVDGSVLRGHLEIGKKLNNEKFSENEIAIIKEWATRLSKILSGLPQ